MDDDAVILGKIEARRQADPVAAGRPQVQDLQIEFAEPLPQRDTLVDRGDAVRVVEADQEKARGAGPAVRPPEARPRLAAGPSRKCSASNAVSLADLRSPLTCPLDQREAAHSGQRLHRVPDCTGAR